jgi:hypothetical protein
MPERVIFHVGLQKSGTTYLQFALSQFSEALAKHGVHYPVPPARLEPGEVPYAQRAMYLLLAPYFQGVNENTVHSGHADLHWLRQQWPTLRGDVLLSSEALSVVCADALPRLLEEFVADEAEVVITVRPLDRMLTASWQESVKNGRATDLPQYVQLISEDRERLRAGDDGRIVSPWRALSAADLVKRWARFIPQERITVVVAGRRPDELWSRFLTALGHERLIDTLGWPTQLTSAEQNVSLCASEATLLCALNQVTGGMPPGEAASLRRQLMKAFHERGSERSRIVLSAEHFALVEDWAATDRDELLSLGVRTVGDLDDARPRPALDVPLSEKALLDTAVLSLVVAAGWEAPPPPSGPPPLTFPQRLRRAVRRRIVDRLLGRR